MTRYFLGVITPEHLDPVAYATGALTRLQHGQHRTFEHIQIDTWWTRTYFGSAHIPAAKLHARLQQPTRNGTLDPVLRLIGILDQHGTWHERARLLDDHTAQIRLTNRAWIHTLNTAATPGTTLTIVFAKAHPQGAPHDRTTHHH